MAIKFEGKTYPTIDPNELSPGEISDIEQATGLTYQKIRRMGEVCVCGDLKKYHEHKDAAGEFTEDTSCTSCAVCEQHEPDLPMSIQTAFLWVAIKKLSPDVRFADVAGTPMASLFVADEIPAVGPTVPVEPPVPAP